MNFLKAEMERKKRQLAEKQLVGPDKKYFKRGDLMEKEREEYLQRNRPRDEDVKKLHESVQTKENSTDKCKLSVRSIGSLRHSESMLQIRACVSTDSTELVPCIF